MDGIVTLTSPVGHQETLDRVRRAIVDHGLHLVSEVDHTAAARSAGLQMPPTTVVIFGDPRSGTPAMIAAPDIALDLPLRVLVRDDSGQTLLSYHDPGSLVAAYGLPAEFASRLVGARVVATAAAG